RRSGREREPESDREAEPGADDEGEQGLEERHPEMRIDRAGREPVPGALKNLERLAEEERGLVGIVEVKRRQERRARRHVPEGEESDEQRELPDAQQFNGVAAHSSSAPPPSSRARSACAAGRSAA